MNISRTIPIFLIATILVFGTTISMGIPASFAEPQSYEDSYGKDYDKSSNLNKQNVNCNNIIINGINSAGQGTTAGEDMLGAMAADEGDDGTGQWIENGDKKDSNSINENIVNFCKNKHNKIVVEQTGSLTVKKDIFGCNEIRVGSIVEMDCQFLDPNSDQWISCDTLSAFNDQKFCNDLKKGFFDIKVTDDQGNVDEFTGEEGTTITNIEPGTKYTVEEIKHDGTHGLFDQLLVNANSEFRCVEGSGFPDGGELVTTTGVSYADLCFEYEDEQGNDCSTTTIAAGEDKTCIVKNYIRLAQYINPR